MTNTFENKGKNWK